MSQLLSVEQQVIVALRRISRAIDLHSRRLLKQCGLTSPQLVAIQAVDRLEPISVGALAQEIHLGQATVTGILRRLEDRGLVSRNRGDADRRSVLATLTAEGRRIARSAPSPLQERFHTELSRIEEWEQTQILATLQRIGAMMGAEDLEAAPLLMSGDAGAPAEDVSAYLEKAVLPDQKARTGGEQSGEMATESSSESGLDASAVSSISPVGDKDSGDEATDRAERER